MDQTSCPEFQSATATRRAFLRGASVLGGAGVTSAIHGSTFTQTAYADTATADRTLVVLSMRGAADGLSLVVPHGDPVYARARPTIQVPRDRLLCADGFFGLHPSLAALVPMWSSGRMAAVHATGLPIANRSHFSAMEAVEDADPGSAERVGWLNRVLTADGQGSPLRALQYGAGTLATQLAGPHPVVTATDLGTVAFAGADSPAEELARRTSMSTLWSEHDGVFADCVRDSLEVVSQFAPVHQAPTTPANGATYPDGDLGTAFAAAARTIRADVGVEVVTIDHGSWDHHVWVGTPDHGSLAPMAQELAEAVAAFFADLGPAADRVTVVTLSEFGRRVQENASEGLDHGHGNVMFLFGAGVRGGSYHGRWPGLVNTEDADLLVTTDYRQVLSEVVQYVFDVSPAAVFPGLGITPVNAMRLG